jgi:hypothetical protein
VSNKKKVFNQRLPEEGKLGMKKLYKMMHTVTESFFKEVARGGE